MTDYILIIGNLFCRFTYSRDGIPTAGIQDRDPVYLGQYTQGYTGPTTNPVPPPLTTTYDPTGNPVGPMPDHNHNHNPMAASMIAMAPDLAAAPDPLLAPAASLSTDLASAGAAKVNPMDGILNSDPLTHGGVMAPLEQPSHNMIQDMGMGSGSSLNNPLNMGADILGQNDPMINNVAGADILAGKHLPMMV